MRKHYNKRWLEQRWDERQPARLAHIRMKQMERSNADVSKDAVNQDSRLLRSAAIERD